MQLPFPTREVSLKPAFTFQTENLNGMSNIQLHEHPASIIVEYLNTDANSCNIIFPLSQIHHLQVFITEISAENRKNKITSVICFLNSFKLKKKIPKLKLEYPYIMYHTGVHVKIKQSLNQGLKNLSCFCGCIVTISYIYS